MRTNGDIRPRDRNKRDASVTVRAVTEHKVLYFFAHIELAISIEVQPRVDNLSSVIALLHRGFLSANGCIHPLCAICARVPSFTSSGLDHDGITALTAHDDCSFLSLCRCARRSGWSIARSERDPDKP